MTTVTPMAIMMVMTMEIGTAIAIATETTIE
jgi:hypothetical protein